MAQDAHDSTEAPPAANPNAIGLRRVQNALLHFVEIVVAYEGGGIEIIDWPPDPSTDGRAIEDAETLATLTRVVEILERHLAKQRDRQKQAIFAQLHRKLVPHYKDFKTDPDSDDLATDVAKVIEELGVVPREEDVREFVTRSWNLKKGKKAESEAAASTVADFIEVDAKTVYNYRSRMRRGGPGSPSVWRTAWRRWIPPRLARRYVTPLFDAAIAWRDRQPEPVLEDARELREPFLAMLERQAERKFRDSFCENFTFAFLGDLDSPDVQADVKDEKSAAFLGQLRAMRHEMAEMIRNMVLSRRQAAGVVDDQSNAGSLDLDLEVEAEYKTVVESVFGEVIQRELEKIGLT